jgi:hypothetical protein
MNTSIYKIIEGITKGRLTEYEFTYYLEEFEENW